VRRMPNERMIEAPKSEWLRCGQRQHKGESWQCQHAGRKNVDIGHFRD
jgi:hypothetical protein